MRETKKIKVGENEIEIKTYLTGGEARQIQNVFLEGMKIGISDGKADIDNIDAKLANSAQDKAIEMVVVSINGKTEVLEEVLNLPKNEFDKLIVEIDRVQSGLEEKKTK